MTRVAMVVLCCLTVLLCGCSQASSPENVAGVRAMYRSIGIDASASDFTDICDSYMDAALRAELQPVGKRCFTTKFEHWAEKIRLSKIKPDTRIVVSGGEALVYDGARPERARFEAGQWRLDEVPEVVFRRRTDGR